MKRVYFAHPKVTYGTAREKAALGFISTYKTEDNDTTVIIDPNKDLGELGPRWHTYLKLVAWSDIVFVLEAPDATLGKGTDAEVNYAIENNIPVFVLRKPAILRVVGTEMLDCDSWKFGYSKLVFK